MGSSSLPGGAPHEGVPSSLAAGAVGAWRPSRRSGADAEWLLQEGLPVFEALVCSPGARTMAGRDGAAAVRFLFALKGARCVGLAFWLGGPLESRGFHARVAALVAAAACSGPSEISGGPRSFHEREALRFVLASLLRKDRAARGSALNARLAEVRSVSAGRVARGSNFGVALPAAPSSSSNL